MGIPEFTSGGEGVFESSIKMVANFKKAVLLVAGSAVQKLMMKIKDEQEIIMNLADMVNCTFHAESALLRAMKMGEKGLHIDIMKCYLNDAADMIGGFGREAINSFASGDEQRMLLLGIKRFTKAEPFNSKEARRRIADKLIADNRYIF
jgi:hypothetical protein